MVSSFNMLHVPHKMAELAFNISHRYLTNNLSNARTEEKEYLLSLLRQNRTNHDIRNNNKLCTALIPSTTSWTNIDCTRQFVNVTFLCQYTTESAIEPDIEDCQDISQDINHDFYCESGWGWGFKTCLKLMHMTTKYVTKDLLQSTCREIGANSTHENINQVDLFVQQVLSYHGFSFIIVLRKNEKVDLCISASSISETIGTYVSSTLDLPFNMETSQQVGVVCFKEPLPIRYSCEDGYKPCNNGECIVETYFCDSKPQCRDGSDELNCTNYFPSYKKGSLHFKCHDG